MGSGHEGGISSLSFNKIAPLGRHFPAEVAITSRQVSFLYSDVTFARRAFPATYRPARPIPVLMGVQSVWLCRAVTDRFVFARVILCPSRQTVVWYQHRTPDQFCGKAAADSSSPLIRRTNPFAWDWELCGRPFWSADACRAGREYDFSAYTLPV